MKFKKSKSQVPQAAEPELNVSQVFAKQATKHPLLSAKELKLKQEEKKRITSERLQKLKKGVAQFFTILFIVAVIFSMIAVPLIIVFG